MLLHYPHQAVRGREGRRRHRRGPSGLRCRAMLVEIVEIDWGAPVLAAGTTVLGYRGQFRSWLGDRCGLRSIPGEAASCGRQSECGDAPVSVLDFTVMSATSPRMWAGERPGELLLVGVVVNVCEDEAGAGVDSRCRRRGGSFSRSMPTTTRPGWSRKGQWVSFRVDGLSLWDEGY